MKRGYTTNKDAQKIVRENHHPDSSILHTTPVHDGDNLCPHHATHRHLHTGSGDRAGPAEPLTLETNRDMRATAHASSIDPDVDLPSPATSRPSAAIEISQKHVLRTSESPLLASPPTIGTLLFASRVDPLPPRVLRPLSQPPPANTQSHPIPEIQSSERLAPLRLGSSPNAPTSAELLGQHHSHPETAPSRPSNEPDWYGVDGAYPGFLPFSARRFSLQGNRTGPGRDDRNVPVPREPFH